VPEKLTSIDDLKHHLGAHGNIKGLLRHASVVARLDSFLEDLNTESTPLKVNFTLNTPRTNSLFHPSSIGSATGKSLCGKYAIGCSRRLYYDYIGAESTEVIEPRTRRIFDTGSAVHAQLQAYLTEIANRSMGSEKFQDEARMDPKNSEFADEYDIVGSTDGIYEVLLPDAVRFGIEFKTINDAGYQKTSSAHQEHLMQGTVYQRCLDLPLMVFVYYNKNDSSLAEFVQIYDERRWEAIARKLNMVREAAIKEEPSPQEAGWHCSQCKYKAICKPPKMARNEGAKLFKANRRKTNG